MIIKEFRSGSLTPQDEVSYMEMGNGPLVYFSSDYIPAYIPESAKQSLGDIFRNWQDKVLIFGQMINEELTVLSISIDGRSVDSIEMDHLCDRMALKGARVLYSGPFNEHLLVFRDQMLIKYGNNNILWRRE